MIAVTIFLIIPFYLRSVSVHSANCAKMYAVACRRMISGASLLLLGSRLVVAFGGGYNDE
jgi:hypothetical protein